MHVFGLRRRHQPHPLIRRVLAITVAVLAACTLATGGAARSPDAARAASAGSCGAGSSSPIALTTLSGNPLSEGPLTQLYAFCAVGTLPPPPKGSVGYDGQLSVNGVAIRAAMNASSDRAGDVLYSFQAVPNSAGTNGGLGCGPNTVSAAFTPVYLQEPRHGRMSGQGSTPYSAALIAQCPTVSLSPPTITRASEPATVIVSGSQFYPGDPVGISLADQSYTAKAGETGAFSQPVTVQGLACGTYPATATQNVTYVVPGSNDIHATFTGSVSLPVSGCRQTLTMNPDVLAPGEATQVTGTGFLPGQPVRLTWRVPHGGPPLLGTQTVTADGGGGISTYFLVMPNDLLGARELVATQGSASITANAIIGNGSMQPSPGDQLLYRGD